MRPCVLWLATVTVAAGPPLLAHHSAAAEYESKLLLLNGTITRVDWMNPHVWLYLDVKDTNGKVTNWSCEGGSPNGLLSNGWTKTSLKPGDRVKIEGGRAKDRADVCKVKAVTLPDGRRLVMGSAQ